MIKSATLETEQMDLTAADIMAKARALAPRLRERARHVEELRQLPRETIQDFKDAGFIRMAQERRFGGLDLDFPIIMDVALEIGRVCGASGWLVSFMPLHNFMVRWFDEQAQKEYWASGPNTISSTIPAYRAVDREEVKGGLKFSGRASFSSGIDHTDWGLLQTASEVCLIPRRDYQIVDDWHVSGLKGTGSKSVVFKDIFVPNYRIVTNQQLEEGAYPGAKNTDNPWLRVRRPYMHILNYGVLAPVIGMGRGVLDAFDERALKRLDSQSFQPAIERPGAQLRFAEASAELDAAEMFMRGNLETVRASGQRGGEFPLAERMRIRRNVVYAAKLVTQAVNRLVDGMDSSALYDNVDLHRRARDARAGLLQVALHWEETAIQYSRVHWGLEPHTRLL